MNCLVLRGTICKVPTRTKSPAGVPHCYFTLEHRSLQTEAGLSRQVYCRIQVVASGKEIQTFTQNLTLGSEIQVTGFIARHEDQNGLGKLVLHAQTIEKT